MSRVGKLQMELSHGALVPNEAHSSQLPRRYGDLSLLFLRILTGAFLIHGTQDNIFRNARVQEWALFS